MGPILAVKSQLGCRLHPSKGTPGVLAASYQYCTGNPKNRQERSEERAGESLMGIVRFVGQRAEC